MSEASRPNPMEWEITADTRKILRLLKSTLHYCDAVGRFCLAVSQIGVNIGHTDAFTASVNLYYSLLHLGAASIKLLPGYHFDIQREFVFPNASNWIEIKKSRLGLKHKGVIDELERLGEDYAYLAEIAANLKRWKEVRELFSYGAVPQLISIKSPNAGERIPEFVTQPVFLDGDIRSTQTHHEPFLPLTNEIHIMVPTVEELVKRFPSFILQLVTDGVFELYQAKTVLMKSLLYAPIFFVPYVPEVVFEETKHRLREWVGQSFQGVMDFVSVQWNEARYIEEVRRGSKLIIKMKVERKNVCNNCGTPISDFSKPCTRCGSSYTSWTWG